ncbi:MAG: TRAP transporter small permease [Beijerinckiaceae bacterium]
MTQANGFAALWRKVCDGLEAISKLIVGGAILAIVLITIVSVWYRYVLNAPLSWTEQVSRILFVWSVFAGAAVLYRHVLHIVIDMFVMMMPENAQRILFWINHALMLLTSVLIFWFGLKLSIDTWDQTFGALEITPASFYAAAPFCGALMLAFWLEKTLDPSKRLPQGEVHL